MWVGKKSPGWCTAVTLETWRSFPWWGESPWTTSTTTSTPNSTRAVFPSPGKTRYTVASEWRNVTTFKWKACQPGPASPSSPSSVAHRDGMLQGTECLWPRGDPNSWPGRVSASREPQTQPAAPNLPQTRMSSVECFLGQMHRARSRLSVSLFPSRQHPTEPQDESRDSLISSDTYTSNTLWERWHRTNCFRYSRPISIQMHTWRLLRTNSHCFVFLWQIQFRKLWQQHLFSLFNKVRHYLVILYSYVAADINEIARHQTPNVRTQSELIHWQCERYGIRYAGTSVAPSQIQI